MSDYHNRLNSDLETGWCLEGSDGDENRVRLLIGDTQLGRATLGLTLGRHGALCDLVVDDPTVSRRHLRIGRGREGLFAGLQVERLLGAVRAQPILVHDHQVKEVVQEDRVRGLGLDLQRVIVDGAIGLD